MHAATARTVHEKIAVTILPDSTQAAQAVARQIADLIRTKNTAGKSCVLGLATGSTPVGVYAELVRLHQEEKLSFKQVITFNLDEYHPIAPDSRQSYRRFMQEHLFDHIDIEPSNIYIPDGQLPADEVATFCEQYEQMIRDAGGIDLQLLGIGRTGHIGFNEPGSPADSRTRMIWLDRKTRIDAASDFFGLEHVPHRAITMGVRTIMEARQIVMLAFGEGKARIVADAVEGPVTPAVSASFLQQHGNAKVIVDDAAAGGLTRIKAPWLVDPAVDWTTQLIRRAAIWLAQKAQKPLLKLTDEDYNEYGLQSLIAQHGPAYQINLRVFRIMQKTITGWPGGKPNPDQQGKDLDGKDFPKRVLIFSPHPDDDVISMGGTLIRLVDQGHEVHVAYQVSGNIAVFDDDAWRFADFAAEFARMLGIQSERPAEIEQLIDEAIKNKRPGEADPPDLRKLKAIIRRGEARAAGRYCGIPLKRLHFLDMPFYETGTVRKNPLSGADLQTVIKVMEHVRPHQIYAAGDLSDPHGTHRVCLKAIFESLERLDKDGGGTDSWLRQCTVWLYRGAWQEWEPEDIDMAIPISPQELMRKRIAIFKHESQKDKALFPGSDEREFWQRAEDRNRATARLYDRLGLAEYEAIEGFVRYTGLDK